MGDAQGPLGRETLGSCPVFPILPKSFTLPHCHFLPHRCPFHPNVDGRDSPAPSWPSTLSCPSAKESPQSIKHRSWDGVSPCAEDAAGLPALLGAADKCFCLGSSFHKQQSANSAVPSLLQAAPRISWVTEMRGAHRVCCPLGSRCIPPHMVGTGPGLSVHHVSKLESHPPLGMVVNAGLGAAPLGDLGKGNHCGLEDILCCGSSTWFLSNNVLCSRSL